MKQNRSFIRPLAPALIVGAAGLLPLCAPTCVAAADTAAQLDQAPLPLRLPAPTVKGTPSDLPEGPQIEPLSDKPRPAFLAPKGATNVALGKKIITSVAPFSGDPAQITDGQKEAFDDQAVEMKKGTQYVQVDLGDEYFLYAIVIWHDHRYLQLFHDVIVQVADDSVFTKNVRTLYNNDADNSSGQGAGTDREYFETAQGRLIDAKGAKARFVRAYTKGSNLSAINAFQEIEVYGLPAK